MNAFVSKYISMPAIRDDYVDNHFTNKFIPLCHIDYFINGDGES